MKNNDVINMVKEKYNLDDSETVSTVYLHLNLLPQNLSKILLITVYAYLILYIIIV